MTDNTQSPVKPKRLTLAQLICRRLPPLIAHRVRERLYSVKRAQADHYPFAVRAQSGSKFRGNTVELHAYYFSVLGYCVWRNLAVALAVCKPGDHIIEIGANVGTETVIFSDIVGREGKVSAFEPVPSNLEALGAALSETRYRNVQIYPCALSDKNGQVTFVVPPSEHKTGIGHILGNEDIHDRNVITVESVTLDSLALQPAAALFIDTEGVEIDVLRGASTYIQTHKPVIVVEVSPRQLNRAGASIEALHHQIMSFGYDAFNIGRASLSKPTHDVIATDWVCVPKEQRETVAAIDRMMRLCAYLPCVLGMNPLSRKN